MTKIDYLRQASKTDVYYTWKSLGGATANNNTKIYVPDNIYLIDQPNSAIYGYLVYCNKDTNGNLIVWSRGSVVDDDFGEISFGNNIVTPYFNFILNKTDSDNAELSADDEEYNNFTPFNKLNSKDTVTISDDDYGLCLKPLGFPFITEEELEYTREEILKYAIKPALEEYFHWIPHTSVTEISASSSEMNVVMPSDAYCVVGLSLQQYGSSVTGNNLSPLWYAVEQTMYGSYNFSSLTGTYTGSNPYTNTSSLSSMLGNRATSQAIINLNRRVHYEGPYTIETKTLAEQLGSSIGERYIKVYANTQGTFNIWWGVHSLNFNDVEFAHRTRVIEYSQACVKELFGNLRSLAKTNINGQIDYSGWLTEAKETKKTIQDEWKKMVKAAGVIRGSL